MASRTLLAILSIFSFALGGCALFTPPEENNPNLPHVRVYDSSFDEVWRAIQKALVSYPIQMNNIDQGVIETDFVKADQVWRAPVQITKKAISPRYQLSVKVIKGKIKNRESTRVLLAKKQKLEKDFFSGETALPSDGLEEKVILYRIEREIKLERSMRKAFERSQIK